MARNVENANDAPYQTPSSSIRGIDPGYDLHVTLDVIAGQLEQVHRAAGQRRRGNDLRDHIDKLQKDIGALGHIMMEAPSAVQAAAIGIDIGRAVQRLGLWDDVDAAAQERHRKSRLQESQERRKELADRKKQRALEIFDGFSEKERHAGLKKIHGKIAAELSGEFKTRVSVRTVRSYLSGND
jgi:hypothetical protein